MTGELRQDSESGRWVVIAPGRARRPGAARAEYEPPTEQELADCPFCAGREDRTPPEVLRIGDPWRVRVVPNLYPAFEHHEVVVHSPEHVRSIAELDDDQVALIAEAWLTRVRELGEVFALINEGRAAGGSLPHAHSQLVGVAPGSPLASDKLAQEGNRPPESLLVAERNGHVAYCPYASRMPYELAIEGGDLATCLQLLADTWRRLRAVEGPQPVNAWVRVPAERYRIEAVARMTIPAGIEFGTGVFVNPVPPEAAAEALRNAKGPPPGRPS